MDLIDFLSTVMMSVLVQLPEFAKDYVYRGALSYCGGVLMVSFLIFECSGSSKKLIIFWCSVLFN